MDDGFRRLDQRDVYSETGEVLWSKSHRRYTDCVYFHHLCEAKSAIC